MSKEQIAKLEKEISDLIKVNQSNFVEHQKNEQDLYTKIRSKDKEILGLKTKVSACDCSQYGKSMTEVVYYGKKHRDAVIRLKECVESQKGKISSLQEEKLSLLDQVNVLELELETDQKLVEKAYSKVDAARTEAIQHRKELAEMENKLKVTENNQEEASKKVIFLKDKLEASLRNEETSTNKIQNLEMSFQEQFNELVILKECNGDLKDEISAKTEEIENIKELLGKNQERSLKSSSSSLSEELDLVSLKNTIQEQNQKMNCLEATLKIKDKNKEEKIILLKRLEEHSNATIEELDKLKEKIQKLENKNPDCRYGIRCKRLFCKFNHRYVFTKVNRRNFKCIFCDNIYGSAETLQDHVQCEHKNDCFKGEICVNTHKKKNGQAKHISDKHAGHVKEVKDTTAVDDTESVGNEGQSVDDTIEEDDFETSTDDSYDDNSENLTSEDLENQSGEDSL